MHKNLQEEMPLTALMTIALERLAAGETYASVVADTGIVERISAARLAEEIKAYVVVKECAQSGQYHLHVHLSEGDAAEHRRICAGEGCRTAEPIQVSASVAEGDALRLAEQVVGRLRHLRYWPKPKRTLRLTVSTSDGCSWTMVLGAEASLNWYAQADGEIITATFELMEDGQVIQTEKLDADTWRVLEQHCHGGDLVDNIDDVTNLSVAIQDLAGVDDVVKHVQELQRRHGISVDEDGLPECVRQSAWSLSFDWSEALVRAACARLASTQEGVRCV